MINVLILEDEPPASERLIRLLKNSSEEINIMATVDSVDSALRWMKKNVADLIFMDIHLGDALCFKIFEEIDLKIPVIFTTAYDQYAIRAFKVNSIDYLLKPVNSEELKASLKKYSELILKNSNTPINIQALLQSLNTLKIEYQERLLVHYGQKIKSINVDEIAYFFASDKVVFLCAGQTRFVIDFTIDKLEEVLDPKKFFRINRKFIVSYKSIKNMYIYSKGRVKIELTPLCDIETIVSIDKSSEFKEWLNK